MDSKYKELEKLEWEAPVLNCDKMSETEGKHYAAGSESPYSTLGPS